MGTTLSCTINFFSLNDGEMFLAVIVCMNVALVQVCLHDKLF